MEKEPAPTLLLLLCKLGSQETQSSLLVLLRKNAEMPPAPLPRQSLSPSSVLETFLSTGSLSGKLLLGDTAVMALVAFHMDALRRITGLRGRQGKKLKHQEEGVRAATDSGETLTDLFEVLS